MPVTPRTPVGCPELPDGLGRPSDTLTDEQLAELVRDLEALPGRLRRTAVLRAVRLREAELATYVEAHPDPDLRLRTVRVDDELLGALMLLDTLLAA